MNIKKLKQEIAHQTRNGRTEVYIRLEDIKELEEHLAGDYGEERINIDVNYINELIKEYERKHFKESLKVGVNTKLVKQDGLNYEFKEIER